MKRVILIVLDSVGIGRAPDALQYGDENSDTIGNIAKSLVGFDLPNMANLGLGHISDTINIKPAKQLQGAYGEAIEVSAGKDTTTGHWEIAGLNLSQAFPTFPEGFPEHIIDAFERAIGKKSIGNYAASGTTIINELGDEHVESKRPIVYTSADSVFQIAAHEEVISLEELYDICAKAREILKDDYAVGRVIARPFIGISGRYERTSNRRDFSLMPNGKTVLALAKDHGLEVRGVGKISDIFSGDGITHSYPTKSNEKGIDKTIQLIHEDFEGIIMTNLVDFDTLYGHRRNVKGYGACLEAFDHRLPDIIKAMKEDDALIITADHGNDPTYSGTDHTRERVPILVYGSKIKSGVNVGTRETFADIGASICDLLGLQSTAYGNSFANELLKLENATN